jgi:hypothetical protein
LTASLVARGLSTYLGFIVQQLVKRDLEQHGNFAQHGDVGCFFSALQFPNIALLNAKLLPQFRLSQSLSFPQSAQFLTKFFHR